ncbi:Outer membrane protein TolC [Chitinophaga costaii]|uniref:Outer membrane protein TolC n=1 Tax=Chitinophaga costaii TaxID=1335309 RepID=A0A1C4F263_9BACT|nr:TolC family protein [Chitinophaga costaii]PUZ22123.1 TolC family protein [Chitinophaga costaii]SCC50057.1 Outer membrane protein TolC [Chitinophaga costaii]
MRFIITTIFSTLYLTGFSQEHVVSLEQSKKAAVDYSFSIKNSNLKINSSKADVAAAKSDYLPSLSVSGVGLYGFKDFVGAYPPLLEKGVNNFYMASATATEAIYAGGKIRTGNELAALQFEVNKVLSRQSVDSVLLTTEQKYWNIVGLQEQKKTLVSNAIFLKSLLKQQEDMLASGLIARNDLLKVKVQLSHLLLNESKLENGHRLAVLDFCLYTGMPYDSLLVMKDTLDNSQSPALTDFDPDTSLTNNNNYQLLIKNVEGEKLQTRLTKGDYLPSVSAGVSATEVGVIKRDLGSSFIPAAVAIVKIPVSDGLWGRGRQKLKQRAISENIAQNNLIDGSNQLKVGIMKNWYDVKDGLAEIAYARINVEQATENLKVNEDNYKAGLAAISDVLDAQAAYQQASSDLINAYATYESKIASYYYIIGKISGR